MENPASWGEAERVVEAAIIAAERGTRAGRVGWSMTKQITNALREAGLLDADTARVADALALADQWEARAMLSYHRVTWEHAQALRAALGVSAPTGDPT